MSGDRDLSDVAKSPGPERLLELLADLDAAARLGGGAVRFAVLRHHEDRERFVVLIGTGPLPFSIHLPPETAPEIRVLGHVYGETLARQIWAHAGRLGWEPIGPTPGAE